MKTTSVGMVAAMCVGTALGSGSLMYGAGRNAGPQSGTVRPMVTKAEYERWKTELSNWGRWGKDDQNGAMNLVTPAKRKQAAGLVKEGITVSLAGDVNTERSVDNPQPYEHVMTQAGPAGAGDRLSVSFHGYAHTHLDAFAHRFFDGKMWNGFSERVAEIAAARKPPCSDSSLRF